MDKLNKILLGALFFNVIIFGFLTMFIDAPKNSQINGHHLKEQKDFKIYIEEKKDE